MSSFESKFKTAQTLMLNLADRSVYEGANEILRLATMEVPLDKGTLKDSGKVTQIAVCVYEISFGKAENGILPYAERWHENEANFQRNRKSHYLSDPLHEYTPKFIAKMHEKFSQLLG